MAKHIYIQFLFVIAVVALILVFKNKNIETGLNKKTFWDEEELYFERLQNEYKEQAFTNLLDKSSDLNINLINAIKRFNNYPFILLVHFSEINCGSCRTIDLPILKEETKNLDSGNIIFTASYKAESQLKCPKFNDSFRCLEKYFIRGFKAKFFSGPVV